eukprot:935100-Rhodomonas_salina.2
MVLSYSMLLRTGSAMCGTELRYAATECARRVLGAAPRRPPPDPRRPRQFLVFTCSRQFFPVIF